ncbi:hypothetical protein FB45DRAFT_1053799 [Roridomyces roridus]|uniref:Uncharacterized protein n=1 Tax=Roridomyces roridus TaxID=1738132 RepID=A0AAD7C7I3_9AGAR|nr:hypothetical protein FB45DRAFT_1053799 [Roridomyces roridus]
MVNENELPKRDGPMLKPVKKPLSNTRLPHLIYILAFLATLLSAYYGYRVVQWKSDVGGWWNLATGQRPPQLHFDHDSTPTRRSNPRKGRASDETVEDRINALADALGMPSRDLASAIAVAVKQHVPPASLSSVAAHQTGEAVEAMLNGAEEEQDQPPKPEETGGVGGMMGTFVGMDEP